MSYCFQVPCTVLFCMLCMFPGSLWEDIQANYTKLMVVRHPFTRLASAYWDKMSVHDVDYTYREARKSVVQAMHPKYSKQQITTTRPYFQEFITKMFDKRWKYRADRHWRSYHDLCSPCAINYDYILKLETFSAEILPILEILANGNKPVEYLLSMVIPKNKSSDLKKNSVLKKPKVSSSIMAEYFNLTMNQRTALYDMFALDMKLYGYGFDINTSQVSYQEDCDYIHWVLRQWNQYTVYNNLSAVNSAWYKVYVILCCDNSMSHPMLWQ